MIILLKEFIHLVINKTKNINCYIFIILFLFLCSGTFNTLSLVHAQPDEEQNNCQKCIIHAQCPFGHTCINECCKLKPKRKKLDMVLKKSLKIPKEPECIFCPQFIPECGPNETLIKQTCKECAYCKPSTLKIENVVCNNPCGIKCCNTEEKCIIIDQCKRNKTSCHLPILKYCRKRAPEELIGRTEPL